MALDSWFTILSTINLVGAGHAIVQALLLAFGRRGNRRANRIMGLFLLVLAIGMANGFLQTLGLYDHWPMLSILVGSIVLTYSPLFYLYIRTMSGRAFHWRPLQLGHFIPFLTGMLLWTAFWVFRRDQVPPGFVSWLVRTPWLPVAVMAVVQMSVYVAWMIRCLRSYAQAIKDTYSSLEDFNLRWLRRRLAVFALISIAGLAVVAVYKFDSRLVNVAGQAGFLLVALNTFATGYRAMLQPQVFFGAEGGGKGRRYQRSSLTLEQGGRVKERLLEMMERERSFLDAGLTLPGLAQSLNVPVNHLSQVINEQLGRNFFDFINGYRVDAAKRMLTRPGAEQKKMITVAFDCGFNSLATFNRVFKDLAGMSPSQFRELQPREP